MEIKEFEDLTNFMSSEYMKMIDAYGFAKPSTSFSRFIEQSLINYSKLYKKPLFRLKKKELKVVFKEQELLFRIRQAINTMPHGKIWQFFHSRLWIRMQEYMKNHEYNEVEEDFSDTQSSSVPQSMVPEVVRRPSPPMMSDES